MSRLNKLLFFFVLLFASVNIPALSPLLVAQETRVADKMMPFRPPDTTPILGQEHAYSVQFRGNGDAVVSMRAAFINEEGVPTNTFSLRIPRVEPRRVSVFQIIRDRVCIRYEPTCTQYQEPDYFQPYGPSKYQKAAVTFSGDTVTVTLPEPVKPDKSGSILIVFSASGYAKKNIFGAYNYAFETFKAETTSISKATVGISVDDDLILAGAKGRVNYRFSDSDAVSLAAGAEKIAVSSPQLDQAYNQVGFGTITKSSSHLEPLESFTVRGRFADSSLKLYAKGVVIGFVIVVSVVIFLLYLGTSALSLIRKPHLDIVLAIGGSFTAAALIIVYTAVLYILRNGIQQMVPYDMMGVVLILTIVITIGAYGFLLITPAIIVGLRRGLVWGVGTFGLTVLFLVINAIVMIVILMLLFGNLNRQVPMYNIMKSMMTSQESPGVLESQK